MALRQITPTDPAVDAALRFLSELLHSYPGGDVAFRLWDATEWRAGATPRVTIVVCHPGALRRLAAAPTELGLGEAYIYDDFDIEGAAEAVLPLAEFLAHRDWSWRERLRLKGLLDRLPEERDEPSRRRAALRGKLHSPARDRAAIRHHYDVSNQFYALWLDHNMQYSEAYFLRGDEDLDSAQLQKLEYVCRKLRLRPGERMLDIGCGWGGLMIHAAKHFGVEADGVTLSERQAEWARARIREEGLADRCRVEVRDYRDLPARAQYDKISSVGMFEHVGEAHLPEYFGHVFGLLRPGGLFLNTGIAAIVGRPPAKESFINAYVFPDGELEPISTTVRAAEQSGFELRDNENLREHYAMTLRHWVRRLEAHADEARRLTDDVTYRIWRLYMAGSAYRFTHGALNLFQTVFVKPGASGVAGLPLTREDWYVR